MDGFFQNLTLKQRRERRQLVEKVNNSRACFYSFHLLGQKEPNKESNVNPKLKFQFPFENDIVGNVMDETNRGRGKMTGHLDGHFPASLAIKYIGD